MNPTCRDCGAVCCKGVMFATTLRNQEFLIQTRGAKSIPGGVVVPCRCRYLSHDNRCTIYAVRPEACRIWAVGGAGCRLAREAAGK